MPTITDRERLKACEAAQLSSNEGAMTSTAKAAVSEAHRRSFTIACQDNATAGTAITETVVVELPVKCKFIAAYVAAPIAVTTGETDNVTFTVAKRTGAGSPATLASATTNAAGIGALAAFVPEALTNSATASDLILTAGDVITFKTVKNNAGKALVAATSYLNVTVVVEEI